MFAERVVVGLACDGVDAGDWLIVGLTGASVWLMVLVAAAAEAVSEAPELVVVAIVDVEAPEDIDAKHSNTHKDRQL